MRDRAQLCVVEYFAKSLSITQGHSKLHPWVGRVEVQYSIETMSVSCSVSIEKTGEPGQEVVLWRNPMTS